MSSVIKCNRIAQQGTIQLFSTKKEERLPNTTEANKEAVSIAMQEAYQEMRDLIESANIEKEVILANAKKEATDMIENAKKEVYAILEMAQKEKKKVLEEARQQQEQLIEDAKKEKNNILQEAEGEMIEVITLLLERIVSQKVIGTGQWLPLIVQKMIAQEDINEAVTIYLSQVGYDTSKYFLEEMLKGFQYPLTIEMNRELEETACIVETSRGSMHYDVQQGLEEVLEEVKMLQTRDMT